MLEKLKSFRTEHLRNLVHVMVLTLPFLVPVLIIYFANPLEQHSMFGDARTTFEFVWKGRLPLLLFLWLLFLECILIWDKLKRKIWFNKSWLSKTRFIVLILLVTAPTVYVVGKYWLGFDSAITAAGKNLNVPIKSEMNLGNLTVVNFTNPVSSMWLDEAQASMIVLSDWTDDNNSVLSVKDKILLSPRQHGVDWWIVEDISVTNDTVTLRVLDADHYNWQFNVSWAFSAEYLILASLFTALILLVHWKDGLKWFSVSLFFIWAFGFFYTVDTYFYEGSFAPFQNLVPTVATLSVSITNQLGYDVRYYPEYPAGGEIIKDVIIAGQSSWRIDWPCAGIHSMVIYSCVILLFLKGSIFSRKLKIALFAVGAVGTFFVNIFRIVTILVIAAQGDTEAAKMFHEYGGAVYFLVWITIYIMIIMVIQKLIANRRYMSDDESVTNPSTFQNK